MDNSIAKFVRGGMSYKDAFFKTKEEIALTGASEHHTGLAVDIVGKNHQGLDKSQASTKEAIWLNEHAAEYGFILRFPQDKVAITGISYESWHFRYVGEEAAKFMKENNLCLEGRLCHRRFWLNRLHRSYGVAILHQKERNCHGRLGSKCTQGCPLHTGRAAQTE